MTTKAILIFDQVDAEPFFYVIDATDEELAVMSIAHGQYINTCNVTSECEIALDCLNSALSDPSAKTYYDGIPATWHGKWHGAKVDSSQPIQIPPDAKQIFYFGFLP
jgi:hypothetical protein